MSSERDPPEPDEPDDDLCRSGIYTCAGPDALAGLDAAKIERLRALIARGELSIDARAIAKRLLDAGWLSEP